MSSLGGSLTNDGTNRLSCFSCDYSVCADCAEEKITNDLMDSVQVQVPCTEFN